MLNTKLIIVLVILLGLMLTGCEIQLGEVNTLESNQGSFQNLSINRDFDFKTVQKLDLQEVASTFNPNYKYQIISFDDKMSNFGVVSGNTLSQLSSYDVPTSVNGLRFNPIGKGAGSSTILMRPPHAGPPDRNDDDEEEEDEQGDKNPNTCAIEKDNGGGFETAISNVVDNGNNYTITLTVVHNGCGGPACKELSHYSVEADPGSYSDMSVSGISGRIDRGPNLGSDPFDGFKIDNTSGIGDGQAGTFTVTYTLDDLQDQRTSAKAGPNSQITLFTEDEFENVEENCGVASNDSDNDGLDDNTDAFPNDPNRAVVTFVPAGENQQGTLLYEDLWPVIGDHDFNDLVVDYNLEIISNTQDNVKELKFDLELKAVGGIFQKGFAISLPIAPSNIQSVSGQEISPGGVFDVNENGVEDFGSTTVVPFFDDAHALLPPAPGDQVTNAKSSSPVVTPVDLQIRIVFQNPVEPGFLNSHPLDYFIVPKNDRTIEIHLKGKPNIHPGVAQLFGTEQDDSSPGNNKFYQTNTGLPWALHIAEEIPHPEENQDFADAYPLFTSWAESGGVENTDWFVDNPGNRNESLLFFLNR